MNVEKYEAFADILESKYKEKNYKIIETGADTKRCLLCFSSNGVYFPDTREEVKRRLLTEDRYEWSNILQDSLLQNYYEKIIYVRDIYKQWYVTGINENTNSMSRLIALMRELTRDYRVDTCGNSAGGYAALAVGLALQASRIFSFSGYFSLEKLGPEAPLVWRYREEKDKGQYYDLTQEIKGKNSEVYWFYPGRSKTDIEQVSLAQHSEQLHFFCMDQKVHGSTVLDCNYKYLFLMDTDQLNSLAENGEIRSPWHFLLETAGKKNFAVELCRMVIKKGKRVLRRVRGGSVGEA